MKRPPRHSRFKSVASELNSIHEWIEYHLHMKHRPIASSQLDRFAQLLRTQGNDDGSIAMQDHWALLCEATGDTVSAIRHREREIELVKRLLEIGGPVGDVDFKYLMTRMARTGDLHLLIGNVDHALRMLQMAKAVASEHGIPFTGERSIRELQQKTAETGPNVKSGMSALSASRDVSMPQFRAVRLNAVTYPVEPGEVEVLSAAGAEVIEIEGQQPEEILAAARDCGALLVVSSRVPGSVIEQLTQCRVISRLGAGTDRIDVATATQCGIVVANVPDFCLNEQAEHVMALLLAFARRLPYMTTAMREGNWTARQHSGVHRVAGQTLGLLGFGASAQAVAVRATAFGLRVVAWVRDPTRYEAVARLHGVELLGMDPVLRTSDFVSLHLPLTEETRHLLDARKLSLLKPTAVLINAARGAIVDEAALVDALQQKRIAGAALDVFEGIDVFALPGTPPPHPLYELDNVILTPHTAGSSVESSRDSKLRGARHAAEVLLGHWPQHVVNPHVVPRQPLPPR